MRRRNRTRRAWGLLSLAPPARNLDAAPPAVPALRARRQAADERGGIDGAGAAGVAGGVAVVVLAMAGGMLVATHRGDAQARLA